MSQPYPPQYPQPQYPQQGQYPPQAQPSQYPQQPQYPAGAYAQQQYPQQSQYPQQAQYPWAGQYGQPGYGPPPPQEKKRKVWLIVLVIVAFLLLLGVSAFFLLNLLGHPECPTDTVWSDDEGRCVSAWIIPDETPEPSKEGTVEPSPGPTAEPDPTPTLDYEEQKPSLENFCNAFRYDDIFDGSGEITKIQTENILMLRDYEGGGELLESSASKSLRQMAEYALEFYQDGDYSHRSAYIKDLENMSGWAGELCVEF
ncbi:MAG: hypothetical protein LBR58_09975 [Propionibacteriaceae bacterium]|jgi:hypothetical protein|nr:hypothetical protein [Propionibacteriaceae bacterium]